jgi:glycolate oxidase FAD binding subunit
VATATDALPIRQTLSPTTSEELAAAVGDCFASGTPIYPVGGGTSLDYGLNPKAAGVALSLAGLNRVVDYPARDMTITVKAGITMRKLADVLAVERQELPIDVPQAEQATLGGVIATNWNGPRRYGLGTVRDYVIGIQAVDGRGNPFKGGGRVVKNVAGYDFCKLLTGSMGTLGVITQVTLRVRPRPEHSILLAAAVSTPAQAETLLAALNNSQTSSVSVVLLTGAEWNNDPALNALAATPDAIYLVVGLEGTAPEVAWQKEQLLQEWQNLGAGKARVVDEQGSLRNAGEQTLWSRIVEWPAAGDAPLVVKANVRPSGVTSFIETTRDIDPNCSILSHAGNGTVFVKFLTFPKAGLSRTIIGRLQPAAAALGGQLVVISNPSGNEATRQSVWGGNEGALELMQSVKRNFDPKDILNPGRFVV